MKSAHPRLVCVLAGLLLAGRAFGQEDPREAERRFRFLLARDEELEAQFDNLHSETPPAIKARLRAQQRRLENGYKHFLNDYPRHTRAMIAYGSLLYDQGQEDGAMRWWEKAIALDPREAYAYNNIANHYGHNGRAAEALKLYDKAIELEPTEPIFHFNWATTCVTFRNESHAVYGWTTDEIFQHSLEQFRKARDLVPQNFEFAAVYAGTFYTAPQPDWQEAYAAWKFCLDQPLDDGQREYVHSNLARVSIRQEHFDEAKEWMAKLSVSNSVRRALERQIAEKSKPPTTSTDAAGKQP
jgi:tetratricopeptide (TPR) repeat protein